jgi:hypothetical protein
LNTANKAWRHSFLRAEQKLQLSIKPSIKELCKWCKSVPLFSLNCLCFTKPSSFSSLKICYLRWEEFIIGFILERIFF